MNSVRRLEAGTDFLSFARQYIITQQARRIDDYSRDERIRIV